MSRKQINIDESLNSMLKINVGINEYRDSSHIITEHHCYCAFCKKTLDSKYDNSYGWVLRCDCEGAENEKELTEKIVNLYKEAVELRENHVNIITSTTLEFRKNCLRDELQKDVDILNNTLKEVKEN